MYCRNRVIDIVGKLKKKGLGHFRHLCIKAAGNPVHGCFRMAATPAMKRTLSVLLLVFSCCSASALQDSVVIPFQRQRFHDKIREEQRLLDKIDGKIDTLVKISHNEEVNLQVSDALFRKIRGLQDYVETNKTVVTNNDKIGQLRHIEELLRTFRVRWKSRLINPALAPLLVENFSDILKANIDSQSMAPFIAEVPLEVGLINSELFRTNKGYDESQKTLYLKYATLHPDKILSTIGPFADEPFADSLVSLACRNNPKQLYDFASATNSAAGRLIRRSTDPMVNAVYRLSQTPNALRYYPFLDDILSGRQPVDSLRRYVNDGAGGYDSVGYFRMLVNTEIAYYKRLVGGDTPVAMFGTNGLRDMLHNKAVQHFITPINELHDQPNLAVRMKAIEPLNARELYYMMVMGENEIYTSSYKHSFDRLIQLLGDEPRMDLLLMSVNMDFFKKFIKMAANFNRLDTVLKMMPPANATILMRAFVANLDHTADLEDAVDVADSYASINNPELQATILQYVKENERRSIDAGNQRGKVVYGLLKTIFESFGNSSIDLTDQLGIPPIFRVDPSYLADDSGRIVEQVFFYGDEDGKQYFPSFRNSFSPAEWKITQTKEWIEIKSLKGRRVWIYANLPLDSDKNLDDSAQVHLGKYLRKNDLVPSVVIHRGHSYWLPGTIARMEGDAKIILLGSCGGYKNLSEILAISPDAHIISTKEIGKGDINKPIINYLNQTFVSGKPLVWKDMWGNLDKLFSADPNKSMKESWDDYVPPYKNLGAIFIKAYNKMMERD